MCRQKISSGKRYWVCHRHDKSKADCPIPQIPETEIEQAVLRLCRKLKQGSGRILRPVLGQLRELRERSSAPTAESAILTKKYPISQSRISSLYG